MKKNKKRSRFGSNVVDNAKQQREKESSGYSYLNLPKDAKIYKERVGTCKLDIIPYVVSNDNHPDADEDKPDSALKGNDWYRRPIWVHRNVGAENETIICPKTNRDKCPICETREQQFRDGMDKEDVVRKHSHRNLYNVIPIDDKKHDQELHIWDISHFCFGEELRDEIEESPEHGIFPNIEDGERLEIRVKEDSFDKNKFAKAKRINFLTRKKDYKESIMKEVVCLDDLFTVLPYKEIEAKFLEIEGEDEDSKEKSTPKQEEKSSPKRSKQDKKGKKNKCPEGYKFGKDWDAYDECDECPVREKCEKKYKKKNK